MTNEEKMLTAALRDLCGWHVGMLNIDGDVCVGVDDEVIYAGYETETALPALGSPANWGHWAAALARQLGFASLELYGDGSACAWVGDGMGLGKPAEALLGAACSHLFLEPGCVLEAKQPPSVLAWWKEHGQ